MNIAIFSNSYTLKPCGIKAQIDALPNFSKKNRITIFGNSKIDGEIGKQDVLIFFGGILGAVNFIIKNRKYKKPIIVSIYETKPPLEELKYLKFTDLFDSDFRIIKQILKRSIVPAILLENLFDDKLIKAVIVPSKRILHQFSRYKFGKKTYYVPPTIGIKNVKMSARIKFGKIKIVYFGHPYSVRGFDDLVDVFDSLNCQNCELNLIFSKSSKKQKLFSKIKSSRVNIVQNNFKDTRKIYSKGDIFVFNYRFSGEIPEYPVALLEAMCFGGAIITTDVGAIREIVNNENGLIIPPRNKVELKKAMELLIKNKKLRAKLGHNAKNIYKMVSQEKFSKNINKILKEVLNDGRKTTF